MFLIEAIRNKLIVNNQTFYEVKWTGYPENLNTFELGDDLPLTKIEEFEKTIGKKLNKMNQTKNYRPLRKCRKNVIIIDDENNQKELQIKEKNEKNLEITQKDNETKTSSSNDNLSSIVCKKNKKKEENIQPNENNPKNLLDLKNKKNNENFNIYESRRPFIEKSKKKFIFKTTYRNLFSYNCKGEINKVKKIIIHKKRTILVQIRSKKKSGNFYNSFQKIEKILEEAPDKLAFFLLNIFKEEIQKNCFSEYN